jgi:high-affinity Fe2+/Pb2+ permease
MPQELRLWLVWLINSVCAYTLVRPFVPSTLRGLLLLEGTTTAVAVLLLVTAIAHSLAMAVRSTQREWQNNQAQTQGLANTVSLCM